jgi:tRNA (guanine26-N2/guanine27-N2)-dimethyltransferase
MSSEREAPPGHKIITEGRNSILFGEKNEVFYNKVQVMNRDLSILMLQLFAEQRKCEMDTKASKKAARAKQREAGGDTKVEPEEVLPASADWREKCEASAEEDGIKVLEGLAGTGLRSIRYLQEVNGIKSILVNDLEEEAVSAMKTNIAFNSTDDLLGSRAGRLHPNKGDATMVMYGHKSNPAEQFDVIDLDPYGSASPFLDGAVQSVADGGMLCVTCTDGPVLSGNHVDVCWSRYGSMPTKGKYLHEMALRMLLQSIESAANRYRRHIEPILSVSLDFYIRVFVRVHEKPGKVKESSTKLSYVYQSMGCDTHYLQPVGKLSASGNAYQCSVGPNLGGDGSSALCPETGQRFKIGGPIW